MSWPCATVPLPGGRPAPSGRTSMSQPAISSFVAALPKPNGAAVLVAAGFAGAAAIAKAGTRPSTASAVAAIAAPRIRSEHLDIVHLAGRIDAPRLDRVVVV